MPNRSKREAQLRLDMGMARVLLNQGKDSREMLEAFREHHAIVKELEQSPVAQDDASESPKAADRP